ncbi:MAG: hypothetical protein WBD20_07660 [Pirellulaceae bacterium]
MINDALAFRRSIIVIFVVLLALNGFAQTDTVSSKPKPLMRDFMGVNGHTVNFRPELYRKVCRLVRDYHPMDWDTGDDTSYGLDFPFARNRVDWSHVYGSWKESGFKTDACVMFETHSSDAWSDLPRDAHQYGKRFAESFGPLSTALVESIEIGNEPGKYSDQSYRLVFENMAKGIRLGDAKVKIATCNVNVGPSGDYHKSVDCVKGLESLYDVLNVHSYAMLKEWPTWKRSYPEDPDLPSFTSDIDELLQWRDQHAPDKEVWLTEFGWDCSTQLPKPEGTFAKWEGNTDQQQAQWLVRSFFLFATRDIDRAYIFFFNDEDMPQLHGASGLTRNYVPKPSFYAVSHLYRTLGDYRFKQIVQHSNKNVLIYRFEHETDASKVIYVAWSPTGSGKQATVDFKLSELRLGHAEKMPFTDQPAERVAVTQRDQIATVTVDESPAYIFLQQQK